jgi:serine protease AprX
MAAAQSAVEDQGGHVEAEIPIIKSVVAQVPVQEVAELENMPSVVRVTPDRQVQTTARTEPVDVEFTKVIGAKDVWDAGYTGADVTVAVLDTGIDPRFPTLRRVRGSRNERLLAYYDAMADELYEDRRLMRSPRDPNGHGTHVAGIIANADYEQRDGEYRGVAPSANLVAVRVLNEDGAGMYADVLRGINWVVEHKDEYNIRVLNISMYAIPVAPYWADPYNLAVMAAWEAGIVVIASSGNTGPAPMSVGVPGNTPYVITVGAFTDNRTPEDFGDDYVPEFSAAGPTLDAFTKPDLMAPGAHVLSLMRPNANLRDTHPEHRVSSRYFEMSGTSMSTAVVSGIAALMLSEDPALTPDEVKYRLMQTARPQYDEEMGTSLYSIWEQGAGRVWASDAVLGEIEGVANQGMDISADLAGEQHYQGWTRFDEETGTFYIVGGGADGWIDGYTTWNGSFDSWADGYDALTNWSGSFDSWAGGFDSWAGSFDSWAGSFDSWAGSFDSWAGSFDSWAGACLVDPTDAQEWADGFDSWAGGFDSWAGGFDSWADFIAEADAFDSWAGSFDSWAGSFDSWAGSFDSWAGNAEECDSWLNAFDSWAGGFDSWAGGLLSVAEGLNAWSGAFTVWQGGYLSWADGFDSWAGSFDSWADGFAYWANVCGVNAEGFDSWAGGFDSWAGGFDSWAGGFDSWAGSFDSWADGFDSWADYVVWVDGFDSWAGSFDSWADGFDSWAGSTVDPSRPVFCESWVDGFDSWAGGFDSWAGSFDSWADVYPNLSGAYEIWNGGYTSWAGGFDSWAGGFDSWAGSVGDPDWAEGFRNLNNAPTDLSSVGINIWVQP